MNKNNNLALWRWNTMIMPDAAYLWRTTLFSFTVCFVWKFWQLHSRRIFRTYICIAYHLSLLWPVASWKSPLAFPWPQRVHLIAYKPINNKEERLCRREMAKALSPALCKQKQCTLQNILETLESSLFSVLSHLHSIKDPEQKVKISSPYKLHLKSWEQLKCSCGCRVGAFSPPLHVAEVLLLRPHVINH